MGRVLIAFLLVMFGFWLGSIPFGFMIAKRLGVNIQDEGSGNIGATNVTRVLGPIPGAVTLLLDALKGALAVQLALRFTWDPWIVMLAGFAAIAGHCFSPWLGFRGGKGVATALGVFVVLEPRLVGIAVIVFAIVLKLTRVPALGSLVAVLAIATAVTARGDTPAAALAWATFALLVYTHRTNLAKLTTAR